MAPQQYAVVAQAIVPLLDHDTLLVASSDFTHFGPSFRYTPFKDNVPENLRLLADQAVAPILQCDFDGFQNHLNKTRDTICGRGPISLLLRILSMKDSAKAVRAAFDTSGNITGDWKNSVTYMSFVFINRPGTLNQDQRSSLLKLARETATACLNGREPPKLSPGDLDPVLRKNGACFVTLENNGQLRGCIGNMTATVSLYEAVIKSALSACKDYRFASNPVTADELSQIHIEISYLTPMKRIKNTDEIIIGRHGLLIALGQHRGVLLPQVAARRGWTRNEFLAQTCRKARLPATAWKRPAAEIYCFEAEVFGEPE
jgi:AmmeMemoRadiSam system protein A